MTDSTLNRFIASGTNAERLAFTPDPPTPGSGPDPSYVWTETDTGDTFMWDYDGAAWQGVGGGDTTALSTSLSQVSSSLSSTNSTNVTQSTSLSQISSSLSGAISSTTSLSTAVSTVISGSISTVTSSVTSLSTAIGAGSGALTLISTTTLGGTATNITFSGISGSYKDLIVVGQMRSDIVGTSDIISVRLNTDTGANYDYRRQNDAGSINGFAQTSAPLMTASGSTAPANVASTFELWIINYAGTTFDKKMICASEFMLAATSGNFLSERAAGRWRSTAAVTEVKILSPASNFVVGTTMSLYGRS